MISGSEIDKLFNITNALLYSDNISFAKQCKSFMRWKSPDNISKLLVESKWHFRLQDRLDEFSSNSKEKRSKMYER